MNFFCLFYGFGIYILLYYIVKSFSYAYFANCIDIVIQKILFAIM